jgi:Leucine-rich repeat (LRR) protein
LKALPGLKRLVLYGSKIDGAAAAMIAGFSNLEDLSLDHCQLNDEAVDRIKTLRKLRSLSLWWSTGMSASALEEIGTIRNLETLDLSAVKGAAKDVKYLRKLPQLRHVDLSLIATDSTLEQLEGLDNLREIDVNGAKVTDAGLKRLGSLRNLERIGAAYTKITDAGLCQLKGLVHLNDLSLDDTAVTNAGLVNLYGLKELRNLILLGTKVTKEGADKLQKALPNCYIEYGWRVGGLATGKH